MSGSRRQVSPDERESTRREQRSSAHPGGFARLPSGILDFGRGTATFTCATQLSPYQRANIFGTAGRVEIEIPVNAPPDRPCRIWHQRGSTVEELVFAPCNQYSLLGDAFAAAVLDDTPVPTPLTDAVANMRALEAVLASATTGAWVALPGGAAP